MVAWSFTSLISYPFLQERIWMIELVGGNGHFRLAAFFISPPPSRGKATRKIDQIAFHACHCERSEAIQCHRTEGWIASLRSQ
jgi:hypothetical protein